MKKFVYLAGPICGCTHSEANDWRVWVVAKLKEHGIVGISPLRCEPLVGERYSSVYGDPRFGTARAIGSKNVFDVMNCDMVLAYLPKQADGRPQSYGTICELAWGFAFRRPTILVSDDKYVMEHPVLNTCAGWLISDLQQAVDVCVGILGGYNGGKNV